MAVLLTAGTGKTSLRIASLLQKANTPFLLASRRGQSAAPSGMAAAKFDWLDNTTFENPFQHTFPGGEKISAVYLVSPEVQDPAPCMNEFIDLAVKKGAKRFVLIGGSTIYLGGHHVGKVWSHLTELGVEYCILQPSWFMENFSEGFHNPTIKHMGKIFTACGDGKIPFISATDIATMAYRGLTDKQPHNTSYRVLGPEKLTYDEIAEKLSKHLGKKIEHVKLSDEERTQGMMSNGVPEHTARFLVWLESTAANGQEAQYSDPDVEKVTGKPPQSFDDFVQENKACWT